VWYVIYNISLTLVFLVGLPFVPIILALGTRYREGFIQRLGFYARPFGPSSDSGRPVWIHAASVGEVRSVEPLVQALKARVPQRKILLSTFTSTGNRVARQLTGVDAVIFLPLDLLWIVRRALRSIDPSLLLVVETEIWPNLLREAFRRGVPTLLLSGRLSLKSSARYAIFRSFFRRVLRCFTAIGMQSREDAERILRLGADERKVSVVGSLKFAARREVRDRADFSAVAQQDKRWLVAGSTHGGEEEILLAAFRAVRSQGVRLSMVLAPRHPQRFTEVAGLLKTRQFDFIRRSEAQAERLFEKDILLLDTVGELADFFAVGDIAFVGGSLIDAGGHNVLEPARFGKPILFGPFMTNFKAIADEMIREGAGIVVQRVEDLARETAKLLSDTGLRRRMGERALRIAMGQGDAFKRNLDLVAHYL
jgi:3-deoxy-D-manno-octulosonic-acid transferase